jgi:uncharacterized protein YyaL (SSP411 family)
MMALAQEKSQDPPKQAKQNRLAKEKSPYLLQHADNPVDWYPWGDEAFKKARDENKPVFLSIGYSTCHWCHVMEHESFENEAIAAYLNENFVSIKVDREERPDIDEIYMTALTQAMGHGSGGWPLTMFLTPERKPFFGGTYFPPEERNRMPGFPQVLRAIRRTWDEKKGDVDKNAEEVRQALEQMSAFAAPGKLEVELVAGALPAFERMFDDRNGGFGSAPKFPQPSYAMFLLHHHKRTRNERALAMVEKQLEQMAAGGIYDHLGGGFARYSTDAKWLVPHFEKMLYDNGQLLKLYAEATRLTGKPSYARVVRETAAYVLRDMTDPKGGFLSAEDADSEGREGKFYVWTRDEVEALLGARDAKVFGLAYDVTAAGNWDDPHHDTGGLNVLHANLSAEQVAKLEKLEIAEVEQILERSRARLLEARGRRVRPSRDDKVLTGWNGLMISGMAAAGGALQEPAYVQAATRAASFIRDTLIREGKLLRRYRDGEAAIDGNLEDYAFLVQGLLDLYEATFEAAWLKLASELNDRCVEIFYDEANGGFYFTPAAQADLIVRSKKLDDGAVPAGGSVAVLNCIRLGEIRSDAALLKKAERSLESVAQVLRRYPHSLPYLMIALDHFLGPRREIVVAGDPAAPETRELTAVLRQSFHARTVIVHAGLDPKFVPMVEGKGLVEGKPAVYVCENYACKLPVTGAAELRKVLK